MDPVTIISAGVAIMELVTKSIAAANNGDAQAAEDYLKQARDHYDQAKAAWDAAPGPSA